MLVNINGEISSVEEARISPLDRGYLYGDGIFETMRSYGDKIFKLSEHLERLFASAKAILLEIPWSKEELKNEINRTLVANDLQKDSAYIRLSISRGESEVGISPMGANNPTLMIITKPLTPPDPKLHSEGWEVITVPTRRNHSETVSPRIKSCNFLNNILAKAEAKMSNADDGIMLNQQGFITEGTVSNIFMVKDGYLRTPPTSAGLLAGVTRQTVIDLARDLNFEVQEDNLTRYDLYTADEVFATVTSVEIIPIVKVDNRMIGEGKPGSITEKLFDKFPRPQ
ncbi:MULTISPECIES: branched-chain-amino-acid transaminase [unclassified Candidatus Frackibacter]|uniref:branched-chain-amino-acid transaminase n=1 Tax=unclassified Candidatus Frackibacter TaxID=2648818 RepID=UPI00079CCFF4|nr:MULTISPECIES: branched-chain-amino-acid transaminase [unclassified Candidatus Frackibacter]KXS41321.1 MAG: branched-chain amino acid aminotransferase [Candidatus Frackibacter sp. T328-2]SDC45071.1 branched chain amino acid aminotransferase apoenzyme [Candidatus Frackibacter sp. WG11]SEM64987.1 branched chain amino acid aminotransferase apoenzyme [Candidatus Frackibacter sp. WG12]SFL67430.1 branched chain amino acid aminotransferase apoenzyme [Candidatus Frackibacter sp. WG13]